MITKLQATVMSDCFCQSFSNSRRIQAYLSASNPEIGCVLAFHNLDGIQWISLESWNSHWRSWRTTYGAMKVWTVLLDLLVEVLDFTSPLLIYVVCLINKLFVYVMANHQTPMPFAWLPQHFPRASHRWATFSYNIVRFVYRNNENPFEYMNYDPGLIKNVW